MQKEDFLTIEMSNNGYYIVKTQDCAVYSVFEDKESAIEFIYNFLEELEEEQSSDDEDKKSDDSGIISTKR